MQYLPGSINVCKTGGHKWHVLLHILPQPYTMLCPGSCLGTAASNCQNLGSEQCDTVVTGRLYNLSCPTELLDTSENLKVLLVLLTPADAILLGGPEATFTSHTRGVPAETEKADNPPLLGSTDGSRTHSSD